MANSNSSRTISFLHFDTLNYLGWLEYASLNQNLSLNICHFLMYKCALIFTYHYFIEQNGISMHNFYNWFSQSICWIFWISIYIHWMKKRIKYRHQHSNQKQHLVRSSKAHHNLIFCILDLYMQWQKPLGYLLVSLEHFITS